MNSVCTAAWYRLWFIFSRSCYHQRALLVVLGDEAAFFPLLLDFLGQTLMLPPEGRTWQLLVPQKGLCWGESFLAATWCSAQGGLSPVAGTGPPDQPWALPAPIPELQTPGKGEGAGRGKC